MSFWPQTRKQRLLTTPHHDGTLLPVARNSTSKRSFKTFFQKSKDTQVVTEFRSKLKLAEDLISKLAFSLREIQGMGRKTKETSNSKSARPPAQVLSVVRPNEERG